MIKRVIAASHHRLSGAVAARQKLTASRTKSVQQHGFANLAGYVSDYVDSLSLSDEEVAFRYSRSVSQPSFYASVYALLIRSLLGLSPTVGASEHERWSSWINRHQDASTGYFCDSLVADASWLRKDSWGARHLSAHLPAAYAALRARPKYPFVEAKREMRRLLQQITGIEWNYRQLYRSDLDNKIMNLATLMQFQRDTFDDEEAQVLLGQLKTEVRGRYNWATGLWGPDRLMSGRTRSRSVQFSYHLMLMFSYDNEHSDFNWASLSSNVLSGQTALGGFGERWDTSACEDLDSIELLVRARPFMDTRGRERIDLALGQAEAWLLCNVGDDGGFVFRIGEEFTYGSQLMYSARGKGGIFPTWFRTLALAYIQQTRPASTRFYLVDAPGYVFPDHAVSA